MAVLWQETTRRNWGGLPLESVCVLRLISEPRAGALGEANLVRLGETTPVRWLLLASPRARVSVNGLPVLAGARVLGDRDEIRTRTHRFFFSEESLARIEAHAGEPAPCPRCKLPIETDQPAVVCPACGVSHHQTEDLPCWTYAPHCAAGCSQSTDMQASLRWTPEDES